MPVILIKGGSMNIDNFSIDDLEKAEKRLERKTQIGESLMLRILNEILEELKDIKHHLRRSIK